MRLGVVGIAWLCAASIGGCKARDARVQVTLPFADDFSRAEFGPRWRVSGGHWEIRDGTVYTSGANNAPLFLDVDLPNDFVIEVDVTSETALVDAKIELMTDGRRHQSGYIFILGGWDNGISVIAREDEHAPNRVERRPIGVVGQRTYRWRIEKEGGHFRWLIDGAPYMAHHDPAPLEGPGHNRLAFSNWQNRLRYDNLHIYPLKDAPRPAVPNRATTSSRASDE